MPCIFISSVWLILYLVLTAYSYVFQITPPEEFIKLMKATPFLLNFLMVVIGAPIVEELLFRGFLFSQLKTTKLGINGSIVLTSLIWTSIHLQYDLSLLIPIFFLGLLLGYLMHKYNSLYLVIIVHTQFASYFIYRVFVRLFLLAKMGWTKGFEPSASGATNRRSNQLSYAHHIFVIFEEKNYIIMQLNGGEKWGQIIYSLKVCQKCLITLLKLLM